MRTWASGRVKVAGGHLAYHRTGGDGPTLVLSHGLTDNGLCWTRLATALEAEFDVIMLDARGHGQSSRIVDGHAFDPGRDIAEAVEGLHLSAPILMGHSVGGRATADCAGAWPGLISRVVLEDPAFVPMPEASVADRNRERFRQQTERYGIMTRAELMAMGAKYHPTWHQDEFPAWLEAKAQLDPNALPTFAVPWQESVARIKFPTLILHGEAALGGLVSAELAEEARALNRQIQTIEIPGAGHNTRRENFEAYLKALRRFLH